MWLARIPEPTDAEDDKPLYATLAAARWLRTSLALTAAVVTATVAWAIKSPAILPLWAYVVAIGVLLAYVDWRTKRLPTRIIAPSYGVVIVLLGLAGALSGDWSRAVQSLLAGAVVFVLFFVAWLIFPRGMGYGDVRLSGILGIALGWLGWAEVSVGIYAGFVFGAVIGLVLSRMRIVDAKGFPFGPFMLVGAWFGAVFGPAIAGYMG